MKTSKVDEPAAKPSPEASGRGWLGRKRDLIERFSAGVNAASHVDRENLAQQMKKLAKEVESLEAENRGIAHQARELREALARKREEAQEVFQRSDTIKRKLVGSLARKRGLLNEISFFEKEKSQLFKAYVGISERLQGNVATLERTLKDLGFFKGEVQVLMDKTGMLERDVPVRYRDMDSLDEKIKRTFQTLESFCSRMHHIEKTIKGIYYMSKED